MTAVTSNTRSPGDVIPGSASIDIGYMVHDVREVVAIVTPVELEPRGGRLPAEDPSGCIVDPFSPAS
jgi:hypothetical protein